MKGIDELSYEQIIDYEIKTHWLASWIWFDWGRDMILPLILKRAKRKYKWYLRVNRMGDIIAI